MSSESFSQSCSNYIVTRDTGVTYTSIAGSSPSLFTWRNTASNQNDDNRSYQAPIGFDFWYLGVRYSQFSADLNGFIDFSSSTSDGNSAIMSSPYAYAGNYMNVFSTANASMLVLAPMYDDIWTAGGGATPIANSLIYKTTGSAPNRILTVEWINFDKFGSSSGTINFQIKLHETTGIVEFIYGTITPGTAAYVYCCGINGNWTSGAPTTAQLLTQQTANTTSFSNTPQNSLSATPTNRSRLTFTAPVPSAAPTSLTFSSVSKTGMTLNWNDNASNEDGYVIYYSTDNINFSFIAQFTANSTNGIVSNLNPGTTYYWQVYAVTEGNLSSALTGTQATSAAGTITSIATGNWNSTTSWNCACVPTSGDMVTIANGHTITLNANGACNSLTIGQGISGQLIIGNNGTPRSLTVGGDINLSSGAILITGATSSTHTMSVSGNIINNGTLNLAPTVTRICNITFNKNGNQTVSGGGSTTTFNNIILNMGYSNSNILEITSSNFSAASNFLTLTNGTFKLSTGSNVTAFTSATTISSTCGLWLNNSGAVLSTTGGTITFLGLVRATSGVINIGNASDQNLTSNGGTIIIDGGTINIAGRFDNAGLAALTNFTMSSGLITLATAGSTSATNAPFNITETGSTFNLSGGTIIIRRSGTGNLGFINTGGTFGTISGGTLQIGDASSPVAQTIGINSTFAVPYLVVSNGVAVTAQLISNSITVSKNVTINSGTLNANSLNLNIGGNWVNNGTFTSGTGTITFTGSTAQLISGSGSNAFNNLTINNSTGSTVTLGTPVTVNGALTLTGGKLSVGANTLTLNGNFTGSSNNSISLNGTSSSITIGGSGAMGTLYFDQTTLQTTNRLQNFTFNRTGQTIVLGNTLEVIGTVTLSNGTLNASGFLTLVSNSSGTARIGQISGTGAISGNVTVQRFIPGGVAKNRAYRFLASPVSGQTIANAWQQDIHITGPGTGGTTCPSMTQHTNGFDDNQSTASSIFTFNETTGAWVSIPNTVSATLSSTTGYRVFVRGKRTQGCSLLTIPYAVPQDVVIKANGTITTGTVNIGLTYSPSTGAGWNFVSNPYPSAIDWNNASWVSARSASITPTIYIWNPASGTLGQYASWNPVGGSVNGGSNVIQSGQAFFVKTTAAATLTFNETYKSTDQATQLFGKTGSSQNVKIQLKDTVVLDETVVFTYAGLTHNFDNLDGEKMSFGNGSIGSYTSSSTKLLTFNGIEPYTKSIIDTIYLKAGLISNHSYHLNFIGTSSFRGTPVEVYLYDKFLATLTNMMLNPDYSFKTNSSTTSYASDRFALVFATPSALPVVLSEFLAEKSDQKSALIKWSTSSEINNSHFVVERSFNNIDFDEIALVKGSGQSSEWKEYFVIDDQPDLNGFNYYRLKQVDFEGNYKYSTTSIVTFKKGDLNPDLISVYPNPVTDNIIRIEKRGQDLNGISVNVYDISGQSMIKDIIPKNNGSIYSFPVDQLEPGVYIIEVSDNKTLELLKRIKVLVQ
ncbi:MAG: fibronectin type III domain-containing protein [Bacteroidia bacterium]